MISGEIFDRRANRLFFQDADGKFMGIPDVAAPPETRARKMMKRSDDRLDASRGEAVATNMPEDVPNEPTPVKRDKHTGLIHMDLELAARFKKAGHFWRALRQNLDPRKGVDKQIFKLRIESERAKTASSIEGKAAEARLKGIVEGLRSFARKDEGTLIDTVDVNTLIQATIRLVQNEVHK